MAPEHHPPRYQAFDAFSAESQFLKLMVLRNYGAHAGADFSGGAPLKGVKFPSFLGPRATKCRKVGTFSKSDTDAVLPKTNC